MASRGPDLRLVRAMVCREGHHLVQIHKRAHLGQGFQESYARFLRNEKSKLLLEQRTYLGAGGSRSWRAARRHRETLFVSLARFRMPTAQLHGKGRSSYQAAKSNCRSGSG